MSTTAPSRYFIAIVTLKSGAREILYLEAPASVPETALAKLEYPGEEGYRLGEIIAAIWPNVATYSIDTSFANPFVGARLVRYEDYSVGADTQ
jgi:hypothetical protein